MRKIIIIIVFMFTAMGLNAQSYYDIGIFGGGSAYHPDFVNPSFKAPKPAFGGVIKYNFNPRYAVRVNILSGQLTFADPEVFDTYTPVENANDLMEISTQMEFNFVPFRSRRNTKNNSTYVSLGLGYTRTFGNEIPNSVDNSLQICIPFTVGWKYDLTKRFGISFEWNVRKIFIGGEKNPAYFGGKENYWYSFAGIVIGYKFGGSDLGRIIWHI